jgi:hypothetical protein
MPRKKEEQEIIEVPSLTITKPKMYQITIKGMDAIIFNKIPDLSISKTEKKQQTKEDPIEVERRTWREKAYFEDDGMLYIPGENIHECLKGAAKYWGAKIPGEGNKTYSDVVAKAIICENMSLNIHKDDELVIPFGKAVNGNPSKGPKSGCKVYKIRPMIRPWSGSFKMYVFDGRLTPSVLEVISAYAGAFIGLCDWRPVYGRFEVENIKEL